MISPEMLRRFSLFAGVDPALFKEVAMISDEIELGEGKWLFHEGTEADALYLVLSGRVELTIDLDEKGQRQVGLSTMVEGDVVGWSALIEPYEFTLGARTLTSSKLVKISSSGLLNLMESNPTFGYTLMTRLAKALGERLTNLRVQFVSLAVDQGLVG
jgi:CRP-like cAMP-binding protein